MTQPPLTLRRWKRAEYDRLVGLGVFEDDPIELIGGQLVVAEPKGVYHASAIGTVDDAVRAALPPGWAMRIQLPVALDDESEPEPDVVVVPGRSADYRYAHPSRPELTIEIADTSLLFDREHKGSLYARGGFPDYWIVNLVDRVLEVYRDPAPDAAAVYGWGYRSRVWLTPADVVIPLAFPSVRLRVSELMP